MTRQLGVQPRRRNTPDGPSRQTRGCCRRRPRVVARSPGSAPATDRPPTAARSRERAAVGESHRGSRASSDTVEPTSAWAWSTTARVNGPSVWISSKIRCAGSCMTTLGVSAWMSIGTDSSRGTRCDPSRAPWLAYASVGSTPSARMSSRTMPARTSTAQRPWPWAPRPSPGPSSRRIAWPSNFFRSPLEAAPRPSAVAARVSAASRSSTVRSSTR